VAAGRLLQPFGFELMTAVGTTPGSSGCSFDDGEFKLIKLVRSRLTTRGVGRVPNPEYVAYARACGAEVPGRDLDEFENRSGRAGLRRPDVIDAISRASQSPISACPRRDGLRNVETIEARFEQLVATANHPGRIREQNRWAECWPAAARA